MFRKQGDVTAEMVKRVVERSGQVELKDLRCGWTTNADTPLGEIRGTKCGDLGGDWTVKGEERFGGGTVTTLWNATIDATTLAGNLPPREDPEARPVLTTANQKGSARVVLGQDGNVTMTVDAAQIKLRTTNSFGGKGSATTPGPRADIPLGGRRRHGLSVSSNGGGAIRRPVGVAVRRGRRAPFRCCRSNPCAILPRRLRRLMSLRAANQIPRTKGRRHQPRPARKPDDPCPTSPGRRR